MISTSILNTEEAGLVTRSADPIIKVTLNYLLSKLQKMTSVFSYKGFHDFI